MTDPLSGASKVLPSGSAQRGRRMSAFRGFSPLGSRAWRKIAIFFLGALAIIGLPAALFTVFFDQAVLVRRDVIYHINTPHNVVALTFDDGPSPEWTPRILDEFKKAGVKATFFMIGDHVKKYPDVARRVAEEGHEIENHTYSHPTLVFYTLDKLEREVRDTERAIRDATHRSTQYFRPPKAWLTATEKKKIEEMRYKTVSWTLNSKDWVTFDDKYMVKYIVRHVRSGDIILFHDSGGLFSTEGGDRHETVKTIQRLVEKLKKMGYQFVTLSELLSLEGHDT